MEKSDTSGPAVTSSRPSNASSHPVRGCRAQLEPFGGDVEELCSDRQRLTIDCGPLQPQSSSAFNQRTNHVQAKSWPGKFCKIDRGQRCGCVTGHPPLLIRYKSKLSHRPPLRDGRVQYYGIRNVSSLLNHYRRQARKPIRASAPRLAFF